MSLVPRRGSLLHRAALLAALWATTAGAAESGWSAARTVRGVALESRPTPSGFAEYRGQVSVCTSQQNLERFVTDASRFPSWVPFTETAHALPDDGRGTRYYVRTDAPWPFRSRDMVYRVMPRGADGEGSADGAGRLRIDLAGEPDAIPERGDAVRMAGAGGRWVLEARGERIDVALRMSVDPGSVPRFFANQRIAATVGGMLANLRQRFPC